MLTSRVQVSAWRLTDILGLFPGDRFSARRGQVAERLAKRVDHVLRSTLRCIELDNERASAARLNFRSNILRVRSETFR
jgi:hypothetical protein